MTATVECRRCGRPLTGRLAREAGIGPTCAQLALLEALLTQHDGASGPQNAVALIAAFLNREDEQVGAILNEVDTRDVAGVLAALTAAYLEDQPDGHERLRRAGLTAATGV